MLTVACLACVPDNSGNFIFGVCSYRDNCKEVQGVDVGRREEALTKS
jgi:hypothetical protein